MAFTNINDFKTWLTEKINILNSQYNIGLNPVSFYDTFIKYYNQKVITAKYQSYTNSTLKLIAVFTDFVMETGEKIKTSKGQEIATNYLNYFKSAIEEVAKELTTTSQVKPQTEQETKLNIPANVPNLVTPITDKPVTQPANESGMIDTLSNFWHEYKELILIGGAGILAIILLTRK